VAVATEDRIGCERLFAKAASRGDLATLAMLKAKAGCTGGPVHLHALRAEGNAADGRSTDTHAAAASMTARVSAAADAATTTPATLSTTTTTTTALDLAVRAEQWRAISFLLGANAAKTASLSRVFGPSVLEWNWGSADLSQATAATPFSHLLLDLDLSSAQMGGGGGGGDSGSGPSAVDAPPFVPVMSRAGGALLKATWGALVEGPHGAVAMLGTNGPRFRRKYRR
jgi:hypothetical protein